MLKISIDTSGCKSYSSETAFLNKTRTIEIYRALVRENFYVDYTLMEMLLSELSFKSYVATCVGVLIKRIDCDLIIGSW